MLNVALYRPSQDILRFMEVSPGQWEKRARVARKKMVDNVEKDDENK